MRVTFALCFLLKALALLGTEAGEQVVEGWVSGSGTTLNFYVGKPDRSQAVAWGMYRPFLTTQGWDEVHLETNGQFSDREQAYGAGFLEGCLSWSRMSQFWRTWTDRFKPSIRAKISKFIVAQDTYLRSQSGPFKDNDNEQDQNYIYWHTVAMVLAQFDGLLAGFNSLSPMQMNAEDLWIMNLDGDMFDIERAVSLSSSKDMSKQQLLQLIELSGRCSGLVKWTGNDLLVAHTTWSDYKELYRSYKHYTFNFRRHAHRTSFSSYPGLIASTDDFYLLSSGLVVIETTLNILDESLYASGMDPSSTVVTWVRTIVANYMADSAKKWVDVFIMHNSGTYNNQWIIIDYKLFTPGKPLVPNTVWVLEQIPGFVQAEDSTDILSSAGYWASYNRPFFKHINEKSMYQHYADKHGAMFTYQECPRARIFKRDQSKITSVEDLKHLMQYNNYMQDPLSLGCPGNAIASRFDLPPMPGSACDLELAANGATDSKLTSYSLAQTLSAVARAGPSRDNVPPFAWSTWIKQNPEHSMPEGQPDSWTFNWLTMTPWH